MKFQLGEMSVGDILDRGLKLLFSRIGTFYAINLIVQAPMIAFQILAPTALNLELRVAAGIAIFLALILTFVGMAAEIKVIEQEYIDNRIGVSKAIGFAMSRFLPLIAGSIVFGLVVFVGLVLCIVPGIIFLCMYTFASQAIVLERLGPIAGMSRSAELAKGHKGRIFGIYLLLFVLNLIVTVGLQLALQMFIPAGDNVGFGEQQEIKNQTNHVIQVLITSLIQIFVSTYGTICLTLAYFDLRTRKEGFDLELAAQGLPQRERDDYDDDRPRRRGRDDDDDVYERRHRDEEDGYDDRPRRRDDDDDRDDRPRRRDDDDRDDRPRRGRD